MELKLSYGKNKIKIEVPKENLLHIFDSSKNVDKSIDEEKIIQDALANPIGSKPLKDISKGKESVAILVSDITRPSPSYKFLPSILKELEEAGIEDIKIVFGLGIHRKQTEAEKKKLVGNYATSKAKLINSDISKCKMIGYTTRGTPIEVFEEVVNSDMVIATGNIEYHYFAGYSGGAKALLPGICSKVTVSANHSMMLEKDAIAGNYKTNPVSLDIKESADIFNIDFLLNVIVNDNKNIIAAVAGDIKKAHEKGIKIYDDIYKLEAKQKADITITSPGGYPKDINLYQAQKALDNVKAITKPGGKIILVAECGEGCGEDTFKLWMGAAKNYSLLYKKIKKEFVLGGHKAVAISKMMEYFDIYLFSDFSKEKTESMGFKKITDIQNFINSNIDKNNDLKITIVPTGRFIKLKK